MNQTTRVIGHMAYLHAHEATSMAPPATINAGVFRTFKRQVLENFKMYRVPVIALDRSTSKEAVCVVFEKVNTGGKALDAFELVTAIYAASGHELRKDWYTTNPSISR
jgi:hypothetical protein